MYKSFFEVICWVNKVYIFKYYINNYLLSKIDKWLKMKLFNLIIELKKRKRNVELYLIGIKMYR